MTECMQARRRGEHRERGPERGRELSNIRMWSTSLPACEIGSPGKLRRPTDCLSFIQGRNNPRLAPSDKGEGIKEPKKETDSDSIIEVLVILGIERKNVNTFNDSFAFDRP